MVLARESTLLVLVRDTWLSPMTSKLIFFMVVQPAERVGPAFAALNWTVSVLGVWMTGDVGSALVLLVGLQ
jgi:hypothetical protein